MAYSTWSDVRSILKSRKNVPLVKFQNAGPVIRPEHNWYAPPRNLADRYELCENFGLAPKAIRTNVTFSANVALAEMQAYVNSNKHFEHAGTNNSDDDVTVLATGGVRLETDGAANDAIILQPITPSTGCPEPTPWENRSFGTGKEVHWGAVIQTTGTITNTTIWAGLKLTNTNVIATDANQAYFRCAAGKWTWIYSNNGTDYTGQCGVTLATGTIYDLKIIVDENRNPKFYINGSLVANSTHTLKAATNLKPFIGLIAGSSAAKSLEVHKEWLSFNIG